MKKLIIPFLLLLSVQVANAQSYNLGATTVQVDTVTSQVEGMPWEILWGPDNHLWITDKSTVKRIDPETGQIYTVLDKGEMNGLGMVLHPDFMSTPEVFVVFDTADYYRSGQLCNLYKYTYSFAGDSLYNEELLLSYQHAGEHAGGRIIIDSDGKLLLTTSDYWYGGDVDSLVGRTLRLNLDGSIPSDNPDPLQPEWSNGHRNSQGMVLAPNGIIYATEHSQGIGQNEINIIEKGKNYGWPAFDNDKCTGLSADSCSSPTFENTLPVISITGNPPSGIDYYDHPSISEFSHSLIIGILWGGQGLYVVNLSPDGKSAVNGQLYFQSEFGRIRDLCTAPDGSVYMITNDRSSAGLSPRIRRLYNPSFVVTSIEDHNKMEFSTYPNPVINQVNWEIEGGVKSLRVINSAGLEVIYSNEFSGNILNVKNLKPGLYILVLETQEGEWHKTKFLKE
jgi:glucose/arabinose dehydrogenase